MSDPSRQQHWQTDVQSSDFHHPPPPPYHQIHSSPALDAAIHQPSPPSYSHSSPSPLSSLLGYLSPPSSPPSSPSADSLLPFVHLSLGLLGGYSWGYSVRHWSRPLFASLAMSATLLSLAQQQGWVDVRWSRVEADVRQWVEVYATRGDALYHSVQRRIQHHINHPPDVPDEVGGLGRGEGEGQEGWEDKVVRAVEALAVRMLTTASGVGFSLGLIYATVRKR